MELIIYSSLLYIIAVVFIGMEGVKHQIGGTAAVICSIVFTPVIGYLLVKFSPPNINISRYIKKSKITNQPCNSSEGEFLEKDTYWVKVS